MISKVNKDLIKYCNEMIIPLYDKLDLAHRSDHVSDVIKKSFKIARDYDVDYNMVYTVAVFHDVGNIHSRDNHHLTGAKMLIDDNFIKNYFNSNQIITMSEAVMDHRASSKNEPRSIYGMIISEADRIIDIDQIIKRTFLFRLNKDGYTSFANIFPEVYLHLKQKYGYNGYLKLWLKGTDNEIALNQLRKLIIDEVRIKEKCLTIYQDITNNIKNEI